MTRLKFWIISTTNSLQSCWSEWVNFMFTKLNRCQKWPCILSEVTSQENKQWYTCVLRQYVSMYDTYFIQFKGSINPQKINWSCKNQISLSFLLTASSNVSFTSRKAVSVSSYLELGWARRFAPGWPNNSNHFKYLHCLGHIFSFFSSF